MRLFRALKIIILFILNTSSIARDISLVDFQSFLYSEINSELGVLAEQGAYAADTSFDDSSSRTDIRLQGRLLREEDVPRQAQNLWQNVVQHGWNMSQSSSKVYLAISSSQKRRLRASKSDSSDELRMFHPFLVCSETQSGTKSGFERLHPMLQRTGAFLQDMLVVFNALDKTCYHVSIQYEDAKNLREAITKEEDQISIVPLTDLMKIQVDTLSMIYEDSWAVPKVASSNDWERLIRVGFTAGHRMNTDSNEAETVAQDIIADIRSLGSKKNKRHTRGLTASTNQTLAGVFSMTAMRNSKGGNLRKLFEHDQSRWLRALEEGLESEHSCEAMFEFLEVKTHHNNQGFDIVLNPTEKLIDHHNDGIENKTLKCGQAHECSASNKQCVASLIMALSTHPLVLSIEAEGPILTSDYEAQWITQTKRQGSRPLRDIGVNGENQIISVIDSGLDINHKYFGPTDPKVFNEWDHSQRKVVRYDNSIGDSIEPRGGHGSKVAGAAVGRSRDNEDDEANGIAEAAKLHIFDIQQGSGGYRMPSAFTLFESMHSTNGKPARVANGSWNTRYRAYPFSCRFFDEALHGMYEGDLYIASAGNEGLDDSSMLSKERTIGNPASCKNTLAVGASQSHGDRIAQGAHGVDYLAAFSSRGPTYDGRMKPDIVAPGASVLTAYAHESGKTVDSYGTSFSAPVVAGNAALIRQYFEEGHLPCKNGNCKLDPSGSLLKAVLMNSGTSLKQVQVARPWLTKHLLEELSEYDNHQGMGLIQLDKTLPIKGHNRISAVVKNNKVIRDSQFHDFFVRATPGKCIGTSYRREFSATLAWYDPPGTSSCAKCLLNDLDITVHAVNAKGTVISGSGKFPNGANHKDSDNNVERIRFKMKGRRRYRIRIMADNLISATTKYSMIASGCFKVISPPNPLN